MGKAKKVIKELAPLIGVKAARTPAKMAVRPNQIWSWDITKLLDPAK